MNSPRVEITLPQQLCELTGSARRESAAGATVREAFAALDGRRRGLWDRLCEGNRLRPYVLVFVGYQRADLETPVRDGDEIRVVTAVTGG